MKMKVELDNGTTIEFEGTQPELEHMLPETPKTQGNIVRVFHPPKHKYKHHTWRAKLGRTLTSALKASNVSADNKEIKSFLQANNIPATKKIIRRVYARLIWMRWKKQSST